MQRTTVQDSTAAWRGLGRLAALTGLAAALGACGGSGSKDDGGTANAAPTAAIVPFDPGPPAVDELSSFVLDATPSQDPDGDTLTYAWQQIDGPPATFANGTTQATLDVTAPKVTDSMPATFRVTVNDGRGGTDTADIEVTVHEQPVVVYVARQENANASEVYRRHAADAAPVRLHVPAANGALAFDPQISPDRRYVAYVADRDGDGGSDLYVARLDGQGEQRLTTGAVVGSTVYNAAWAPDGSRLAFRGNLETFVPGVTAGNAELYVARPDFVGGRTKVSGAVIPTGDMFGDFRWAPDSASIAFRGDLETDGVGELYVVPAAGGARVKVSGALVTGGSTGEFAWSPDGTRIAMRGDFLVAGVPELFVAAPDGATPRVKVSGAAPVAGGQLLEFRWSPDSATLAFMGSMEDSDGSGALPVELYTVAADGVGGRTRISGQTAAENTTANVQWLVWSPDSARLVFWAAQNANPNRFELYSAPRGVAGARVKVSGPSQPTSITSPFFAWHPDGEHIAFVGDLEVVGRTDVYVAMADGSGARTKLFGNTVGGTWQFGAADWLEPLAWSPDGEFLAFRSVNALADDGERHLIVTGLGGGSGVLAGADFAGGLIDLYQWLPSGGIAFTGDLETDGEYELFWRESMALPREKLSGPLAAGGFVEQFAAAGPVPQPPTNEREQAFRQELAERFKR